MLENEAPFRLTGYYGHANRAHRVVSWNLIKALSRLSTLPWCLIGDFNDILSTTEKRGGAIHPSSLIHGFREAVEACHLKDLGFLGPSFTWERSRGGPNWVQERLDRGFATDSWIAAFPQSIVTHLPQTSSDHLPLFLELKKFVSITHARRFRFENLWCREAGCKDIISGSWHSSMGSPILQRLSMCGDSLQNWQNLTHQIRSRIRQQKDKLRLLKGRQANWVVVEIEKAGTELQRLLKCEEDFWHQRAKLFWLQSADRNTGAFHRYASTRARKKNISRLQDVEGQWVESETWFARLAHTYFSTLFTSSQPQEEEVVRLASRRVTEAHNAILCAPFQADEVKVAVFSMKPDKAPGIDGFNPAFYQRFWDIIGPEITASCITWLEDGHFPRELNETLLVLIPKKNQPIAMPDLRPIALCNILYKILSKILSNQLRVMLPDIIAAEQNGFVAGRLITDNVIIANEVVHTMKVKRSGHPLAALKIDIATTYDKLEWSYLEKLMLALGFHGKWVTQIMYCVRSVSFRTTLSGVLGDIIHPQRGLRQGDPLSPFLFIITAEGLSMLIKYRESANLYHGIKIARGAPSISHLFFADDAFLFFRAKSEEATTVSHLLQQYRDASGQEINLIKSSIIFSHIVREEIKTTIRSILGVQEQIEGCQYLGKPLLVGRRRSAIFEYIKHKLRSRIDYWRSRGLSRAGKEILLKTVAQALPTYVMSLYVLPVNFCSDFHRMMNAFWWGSDANGRGIEWMKWERLCAWKGHGALGFRDLPDFNTALLAKQGWRILKHPESLMAGVLKAKYFPKSSFIDASLGHSPSLIWRSIWKGSEMIRKGSRHRIGWGIDTQIWKDPWLPCNQFGLIESACPAGMEESTVSELMLSNSIAWDENKLCNLFSPRETSLIMSIPLTSQSNSDSWYWMGAGSEVYFVKYGYKHLRLISDNPPSAHSVLWNRLWKIQAMPKVISLVWRAVSNTLPTKARLKEKHIVQEDSCPVCNGAPETSLHALVTCGLAKSVLIKAGIGWHFNKQSSFLVWFEDLLNHNSCSQWGLIATICWELWRNRNRVLWEGKRHSSQSIVYHSRQTATTSLSSLNPVADHVSVVPSTSLVEHWIRPLWAGLHSQSMRRFSNLRGDVLW